MTTNGNQLANQHTEIYEHLERVGFKLMSHQKEGIKWMLERELLTNQSLSHGPFKNIRGGLLCDDPGLGKTIQTCATLFGNKKNRTLIIAPTLNILKQWVDTIEKILPDSNICIHHGTKKLKSVNELNYNKYDIILATLPMIYEKKVPNVLNSILWDRVVIDEIHYIKNSSSKSFKGAEKLSSTIKWGLTGTPIQNKVKDIQTLYRYVFSTINGPDIENKKWAQGYIELMNTHFLKRRQKSTVTSLKKLNDNIEIFSSSTGFDTEEERNIYITIKNNIIKEYMAMENTHTNSEKMMVVLGLILRLRQVSIHPQIAINALNKISTRDNLSNRLMTFKGPSTKFNNILKIVTNKVALNQNTIIFCYFREEMDSLSLFLKENYIDSRLYNGSMSIKEKEKVLKEFVSPITMKEFKLIYNRLINLSSYDAESAIERHIPKVLLIQIKSGGVGLNLQQFNNVIFTSPDWNPTNQYQAIARAHRIGQKMKVNVYNILINDDNFSTIDDRIRHLQFKKQDIIKKILNELPTYALLPITEHDEMYPHQTTHDRYLEYTAILQ